MRWIARGIILVMVLLAAVGCSRVHPAMPPGMIGVTPPPGFETHFQQLEKNGVRDWVLHLNNIAVKAMRSGDHELAKRSLNEAILIIDSIQGGTAESARAKSPFFGEDQKIFKGDPYERVMTFVYRGILYMQDEDWGNARASFRSAILQDAFAQEGEFRGDWVLPELLIAACELRMNRQWAAEEATQYAHQNFQSVMRNIDQVVLWDSSRQERERFRQISHSDVGEFLRIRPEDNLIVVTQFGESPRKVRQGSSGQYLGFERGRIQEAPPVVKVGNNTTVQSQFTDSLFYQSVTRGGREIDGLQARKALLKEGTDVLGTAGLYAGGYVLSRGLSGHGDGVVNAGLITLAVAGVVKVFSELTTAKADIRQWGPLPDSLGIASFSKDEGIHTVSVMTAKNREISREIYLPKPGSGLVVILAFPGNDPALLVPAQSIRENIAYVPIGEN